MLIILIIWVLCALWCVYQRTTQGTNWLINYWNTPEVEDIVFEYIVIVLLSPVIIIYKWGK